MLLTIEKIWSRKKMLLTMYHLQYNYIPCIIQNKIKKIKKIKKIYAYG